MISIGKNVLIQATGISKAYEDSVSAPRLFFEGLTGIRSKRDKIDALLPLDLEIHRGGSVGVLGRNGAGKSTLLGLIAGHMAPTEGKIERFGRVAALIGIGQAFNVNETGRFNAAQFCRVLGLTGSQAKEAVRMILEFSELGAYFDRPVKTYSSGMRARLSFSCATFVEADLIIIDEVLAVGDAEFRSKCYGHIEQSIDAGQTFVMVSHSPAVIGNYCSRALVLDKGKLVFDGDPLGGMQAYEGIVRPTVRRKRSAKDLMALRIENAERSAPLEHITIDHIEFDAPGRIMGDTAPEDEVSGQGERVLLTAGNEEAEVRVRVTCNQTVKEPRIAAGWRNGKGLMVAVTSLVLPRQTWQQGETYSLVFRFRPRLVVGGYLLRLNVSETRDPNRTLLMDREGLIELVIADGQRAGLVDLDFTLECKSVPEA